MATSRTRPSPGLSDDTRRKVMWLRSISDTGMQQLVQAMSVYTPPAEGQTTLPPDVAAALAPALAANWQHA